MAAGPPSQSHDDSNDLILFEDDVLPRRRHQTPQETTITSYSPTRASGSARSQHLLDSHSPSRRRIVRDANGPGLSNLRHGQIRSPEPATAQPPVFETPLKKGWSSFRNLASNLVIMGGEYYAGTLARNDSQGPANRSLHRGSRTRDAGISSLSTYENNHERDGRSTPVTTHTMGEGDSDDASHVTLDSRGDYKRRTSDANPADAPNNDADAEPDLLVYIHRVQPGDTYAGLTLKYRCHQDDIGKANGLWTRDSIGFREWLAVPVNRCEIRGTPCTPDEFAPGCSVTAGNSLPALDGGALEANRETVDQSASGKSGSMHEAETEVLLWRHVRWVRVESFANPIEIVRMPRRALSYFPPRRKKSTSSALPPSPHSTSGHGHNRLSELGPESLRRSVSNLQLSSSQSAPGLPAVESRSRFEGGLSLDQRPSWMRQPGGVGTLDKTVAAPGPQGDYLNSWAKKHFPGLNLDSYPSMSIPEGDQTDELGGQARISTDPSGSRQGTGLDRAAAAVETWVRGAVTTLREGTQIKALLNGAPHDEELIELEDNNGDEGHSVVTVPSISVQSRDRYDGGFATAMTRRVGTTRGSSNRKLN